MVVAASGSTRVLWLSTDGLAWAAGITEDHPLPDGVAVRTGTSPGDVRLTPEVAAAYYDGFKMPTPDEGPPRIVAGV